MGTRVGRGVTIGTIGDDDEKDDNTVVTVDDDGVVGSVVAMMGICVGMTVVVAANNCRYGRGNG